jgi:hypothetical protein
VPRAGTEAPTAVSVVALLAVVCCAGLPLIGTLGGIALAVLLGVAGGLVVVAALTAAILIVVRARRRRVAPRTHRSRLP